MSTKNIKDLEKTFADSPAMTEDINYLKKLLDAKETLINQLFKKIDELQDIDRSKVIKLNLTAEEQICEIQIQSLLKTSQIRDLTLEETKKLDLLIKNKRLYNNQSTLNADHTVLPSDDKNIDDERLMELASVQNKKGDDSAGS